MAVAVRKFEPEPAPKSKTFYATVHVTRAEGWFIDAQTEEEARQLLESGVGHRCGIGERIHTEVVQIEP
jgi:hypothetical protein